MNNEEEIEIITDENGLATDPAQLRMMLHDIACRAYDMVMNPAVGLFVSEDSLVNFIVALSQAHSYSCPHKGERGDEQQDQTTPPSEKGSTQWPSQFEGHLN